MNKHVITGETKKYIPRKMIVNKSKECQHGSAMVCRTMDWKYTGCKKKT